MPVTLKTINAGLAKQGFKASLAKGDGYCCFQSKPLGTWIGTVRVPALRTLTLDQWIEEFNKLREKNRQLMGRVEPAKRTQAATLLQEAGTPTSQTIGALTLKPS